MRRDLDCFASLDWGFNAKGVCLWWLCLPDGQYHILREYVFTQTPAEDVAREIRKVTTSLGITRLRYLSCDPAMWQKTGAGRGESIAETLIRCGLPCRKSDNDRFNGWTRVHELLRPRPDGAGPWLTIDPGCKYLRRTIPAMVQDKHDPDDLDTNKDDHGVDALRYGAMSRPSPTRLLRDARPKVGTIGWWKQWHQAQERPTGALA